MKYVLLGTVLAIFSLAVVSGCAAISGLGARQEVSGQRVPLPEIPAPARIALERLTAGGEIKVLTQKTIDGKAIYHVEARVGERDVEYDVIGDGTVVAAGESVACASLPGGVLAAVRRHFGGVARLRVCKELKGGQIFYKVGGKKKGSAAMTLKLTDAGRIIAKEKS